MTHINIKISKAVATAEKDGIITTGMVGVPVSFMFDSGWDGLIVTAVFKGSGAPISVQLLGATETVVPWEVLKRPSTLLRIGAEGRLPDGTLVIPTTWATVGTVMSGANATDDLAKPPTPTAFDRITSQIGNMNDLATEDKSSLVAAINEALTKGGGEVDPEEVWRIVGEYLASNPPTITESDPTVPAWAKEAQKPSYTASEVGADPSGTATAQVAAHNTGTDTHSDIRLLISGLTDRLNALADSDDTTLDQLSEVVAHIKSNRTLIEAITTSKVSVSDIIDNLTTNATNKPLSAAQGVVIKTLIDALRNDKLDAAELTNAINTALAQAKASGEFDGADGQPGENGADGFSPTANVTQNDNGATITIADKHGTTTATVTNGKDGADGNPGADGSPGKDGADGKSAYQYAQEGGYTGTEEEFAAKMAQEMPEALPNPNALTFTGAVDGSYDGSAPMSVEIPSGGGSSGGGGLPNWRLIKTLAFSSEIESITFSEDDNGDAFAVKEFMIVGTVPVIASNGYLYCGTGESGSGNDSLWPTSGKEMRWWLASVNGALKTMLAVSNTAVTSSIDKNIRCPSDIVQIIIGASAGFTADGNLYVYGR